MARVRERVRIPLATNMCIIDLDSAAEGITLGSVDVILGDIFEWGGITAMLKLKGVCEMFQINLNLSQRGRAGHRDRRLSASRGGDARPCRMRSTRMQPSSRAMSSSPASSA